MFVKSKVTRNPVFMRCLASFRYAMCIIHMGD